MMSSPIVDRNYRMSAPSRKMAQVPGRDQLNELACSDPMRSMVLVINLDSNCSGTSKALMHILCIPTITVLATAHQHVVSRDSMASSWLRTALLLLNACSLAQAVCSIFAHKLFHNISPIGLVSHA